ncbi:MAG: aldo/keto reductase, partial [Clostridia bacterium]|nr:aldo/keto reductase [Clostridia bacterium]
HIAQYGPVMESWVPLGGRGNTQVLFNDPTIAAIAGAHGKTSAQVILRWHLQAGTIAIPGSSNPDHSLESMSIFDFELTDDEMAQMTGLDRNDRFAEY